MHLWTRRTVLAAGGAAVGAAAPLGFLGGPGPARADGHGPLIHTAAPAAAAVDSVVLLGEEKALVIDAQFVKPEAEALVAAIDATGRSVETIFITHFHPDHHFGVAVLKARWPEAQVVAHPKVAARLGQMGQAMFDDRKAKMGEALPDRWLAPAALDGDHLTLEGERFAVLDPMHGDTAEITPVLAPQFDAVVATDLVYNGTHVWLAESLDPQSIAAWRRSLDALEAMDAGVIIPGHRAAGAVNDASGIAHTRRVLDAWEASLAAASSAEELTEAMTERLGDLPAGFFVQMAAAAAYPE